jgi:hypothetical protein
VGGGGAGGAGNNKLPVPHAPTPPARAVSQPPGRQSRSAQSVCVCVCVCVCACVRACVSDGKGRVGAGLIKQVGGSYSSTVVSRLTNEGLLHPRPYLLSFGT